MKIDFEILQQHPELTDSMQFVVPGKDLRQFGEHIARIVIADVIKDEKPDDTLLSSEQTCQFLGISKPTLWAMDGRGDTNPIRLGNSKKYRLCDLRTLIKEREFGKAKKG